MEVVNIVPNKDLGPGILLKARTDGLALDVDVDFKIFRPVISPTTEAIEGIIVCIPSRIVLILEEILL